MHIPRLVVVAAALALASAPAHSQTRAEKNQARLAKMLEGRTAGEPLTCIPGYAANRLEVIEGVALVYNAGNTLYVAKPTQPDQLRRDDILVVERYSGQLCHTDVVRTIDRSGGFLTGVLFLDKFVPYKKAD
ncbi:MAG: hypothetical protein ABW278_16910 [Steroidobacteraceae bacterium]